MTGFGYDASHSLVKARQAGLKRVLYRPLSRRSADRFAAQPRQQRFPQMTYLAALEFGTATWRYRPEA